MRLKHRRDQFADNISTVTGTLKGYDQLMNLVLDNVKELTRGTCTKHVPRRKLYSY